MVAISCVIKFIWPHINTTHFESESDQIQFQKHPFSRSSLMCNNKKMIVIVVYLIAFAKCLLEGKNPSLYDFVNPRKHLAQFLPEGIIPPFPKVFAEHIPQVLNKLVHIQLKPVTKKIEEYDVDFICMMYCLKNHPLLNIYSANFIFKKCKICFKYQQRYVKMILNFISYKFHVVLMI